MSNYLVPIQKIRREHKILNSRFIATLAPAFSVEEARAFIAEIKKEFADASHNVPAYIIGGGNTTVEYCSDDGEPNGTAGKPALTVLRGSGLGDAVLVITRYFGGTLLGAGGLVKAYTESAQLAAQTVERGRRVSVRVALAAIPYPLLERTRILTSKHGGKIVGEDYAEVVTLTLQFPIQYCDAFQADLRELSAGKVQAQWTETKEEVIAEKYQVK
ncbi:MAG: YigZ family protein [Anaerolineales bacterium]|nr:YigZ family protein [Anaerolineales bacterium]